MTKIPIISTGNEPVHCDFLVQEKRFHSSRGVRNGQTGCNLSPFSRLTKKPSIQKPFPPVQIKHRSAKTIPHADFLSRYATMSPSSKPSHIKTSLLGVGAFEVGTSIADVCWVWIETPLADAEGLGVGTSILLPCSPVTPPFPV